MKEKRGGLTISQIHILDHQTDEILCTLVNKVNAPAFFNDNHIQNIKNLETYDSSMLATIPAAAYATKRNRVVIQDDDGHLREFIILETAQRNEEKRFMTVASYIELKKSTRISPTTLESQTVSMATEWTLAGTGWKRGITEYAGIRKVVIDGYMDPYQVLKYLASLFGLELRFRIEVDGNRIIGRFVDMIKRQGEDTKKETRLGKDLVGVERIENSDIVTALRVIGPELEDGSRLVVEVKNEEARQRWARDGQHLWEDYEPSISGEDTVTVERLTELGEAQLAKRINTTVQYTVEAVSMEEIFGYTHEKVRLGDTIRIKDTSYSPPLYLEARVIEIQRSISGGKVKRKYVLGDFIEYAEEDLMKTFLQLQQIYGAKVIRSDTPPANPKQGMIWVDTSGERHIIKTWNSDMQIWENAVPVAGKDYHDKETADQKEQALHDELTHYTDIVAEEKKHQAIGESKSYTNAELEAKRLALEASLDVIRNDLLAVEQQAQESIDQIISIQDQSIQDISNLQTRADSLLSLAETNQADLIAANGKIVTVEQNINTLEGSMVTTIDQLTSIDGIVSQQQTTIEQQAGLISQKASQTTVNTLTGRVTTVEGSYQTLAGQVTLKANSVDVYTKAQVNTELGKKVDTTIYSNKVSQLELSINGISNRVSDTEVSIDDLSGEITSTKQSVATLDIKANGIISDVSSLNQTVTNQGNQITSANSNISQLSNQITQRVTKTEFNALSIGGRNLLKGATNTLFEWNSTSFGQSQLKSNNFSFYPDFRDLRGKVITVSYEIKTTNLVYGNTNPWVGFETNFLFANGTRQFFGVGSTTVLTGTNGWKKYSSTIVIQDLEIINYGGFSVLMRDATGQVSLKNIKIELGNKATDHTIAPEDIDSSIQSVNQYASEIDQKADGIISSVSSLTQTVTTQGTQISSANSSISQLSDRIDQRVTKTEFEALSIGGRNLLKSSYLNRSSATYNIARIDLSEPLQEGTPVTLSIKGQLGSDRAYWGIYNSGGSINMPSISVRDANGLYKNTFTWRVSNSTNTQLFIYHMHNTSTTSSYIEWVKLEKGNKATDWTPAPEDVQGQIDGQAGRIATAETTIQQQAGQIALKASQSSVDTLTNRISTAETTLELLPGQLNAKVEKNGVVAAINLSPELTRIQSSRLHIDGNVTFSNGYDPSKVTFTGQNIIEGSLLNIANRNNSGSSLPTIIKDSEGHNVVRIESNGSASNFGILPSLTQRNVDIEQGKEYTISFEIRGNISFMNYIYLMRNDGANRSFPSATGFPISTSSWTKVYATQEALWTTTQGYYLIGTTDAASGKWFEVRKVKLEEGKKATTYIPNPKEIQRKIDDWTMTGKTTINGGHIETDTITAVQIKANEISVVHIKDLNGLNINNQFVVDSSGNVTLKGKLEGVTGSFSGSVTTSGAGGSIVLSGDKLTSSNSSWTSEITGGRMVSRLGTESSLSTTVNPNGIFHKRDNRMIFALTDRLVSGKYTADLWAEQADSFDLKVGNSGGNPIARFGFTASTDGHSILRVGNAVIKGLDTTAKIQIRDYNDSVYSDLQVGAFQYQSMSQFSRRDYKKNISDVFINPLSFLNELTFKDFHYKEQSDFDRKHLGLILDETDSYFHDATGDGIDTLRLLHVNTMAIQELDKRDNERHLEIEALKKQVAAQQQRIIALENQIAS